MASRKKKQIKKIERLLSDKNNRQFHHELAIHELKMAVSKYDDTILKEAAERCAQIIYNQDATLMEWELDRIFGS